MRNVRIRIYAESQNRDIPSPPMSNSTPAGDRHGDASRSTRDSDDGDADPNPDPDADANADPAANATLEAVAPTLAAPLRAVGFWGAIVLPLAYLPVLATGLSSSLEAGLFLGLLGVNFLALYVGHAHRRRDRDASR